VSFRFWQRWLQGVCVASALAGLLFVVAPGARVLDGYNRQVVEAFHGSSSQSAEALDHQRFAIAVLGSAMLGWSIVLLWVATVPFGRREAWAWRSIAASVAAWVLGDSIVSYRAGVGLELLWNAIVVVSIALPLAMTYRAVVAAGSATAPDGLEAAARRAAGRSSR
jgi:hypothetical protein